MTLATVSLDALTILDERSFRHVGMYADLKQVLQSAGVSFRTPARGTSMVWGRALFLNLTFWSASEPSDVFMDDSVSADVLAHAAWHHLARCAFDGGPMGAAAMFMGEAIASAFDLYLVGRLLGNAPDADFLETQVPAMAERATDAGMSDDDFQSLVASVADAPERAFEDLRALLYDAAMSLVQATSVDDAAQRLDRLDDRRFAPLLHHYELSNWILFARAYGAPEGPVDVRVTAVDTALRAAPDPLAWLDAQWVQPALRNAR